MNWLNKYFVGVRPVITEDRPGDAIAKAIAEIQNNVLCQITALSGSGGNVAITVSVNRPNPNSVVLTISGNIDIEELKGDPGEKGDTGERGPRGEAGTQWNPPSSFNNWLMVYNSSTGQWGGGTMKAL